MDGAPDPQDRSRGHEGVSMDIDRFMAQGFYRDICSLSPANEAHPALLRSLQRCVAAVTGALGIPKADPVAPATLAALQENGILPLGRLIEPATVARIVAAARQCPVFNGEMYDRSDGIARHLEAGGRDFRLAGYRITDIIGLPHLLELANHPSILALVEAHLGCCPTISLTSLWWSFPESEAAAALPEGLIGQAFHRDDEDLRAMALFVYLTDVATDNGAHRYLRGSHAPASLEAALQQSPAIDPSSGLPVTAAASYGNQGLTHGRLIAAAMPERILTVEGPAGTAFLADTRGLHQGLPPVAGERLLFVARYGMSDNRNRMHLKGYRPPPFASMAARLGSSVRSRYINRVLLDSGMRVRLG